MRDADAPAYGRDVDNVAASLPPHDRQHCEREVYCSPEHEIHRVLEIGLGKSVEWPHLDFSGVVDKNVNAAEPIDHVLDERRDIRRIAQVGREWRSFDMLSR